MKKTKVITNQSKTEPVKASRRAFLRSGVAATGGLVAAVAITGNAQAADETLAKAPPKDEGYRVTEHVSLYYKSVEV